MYLKFGSLGLHLVFILFSIRSARGNRDCYNVDPPRYYGNVSRACDLQHNCYDCITWDEAHSRGKYIGTADVDIDHNYCRFTGPNMEPHCWVDIEKLNDAYFLPCYITPCDAHAGCMVESNAYRGFAMFTKSGYQCVPWNTQTADKPINSITHTSAGLSGSYCRDPDNSTTPWCYYRHDNGTIRRDKCQVPFCASDNPLAKFKRTLNTNFDYNLGTQRHLVKTSAQDCARACLEERDFVCRTFFFNEISKHYADATNNKIEVCIYTNLSMYMPSTELKHHSRIDLFTRLDTKDCPLPLGMASGAVKDSQITSSSNQDLQHTAWYARLHNESYWQPRDDDTSPWIQVSFTNRMLLTGVIVQGGGVGIGTGAEDDQSSWITSFYISVSYDNNNDSGMWNYSTYETLPPTTVVFDANGEPSCTHPIMFQPSIRAFSIRLHPLEWHSKSALRLELLGCVDNDCNYAIGLSSGAIHNSQFTASDKSRHNDELHGPYKARLVLYGKSLNSGWMPTVSTGNQQWLQVNFPKSYTLNGITTQGCGTTESWVKTFSLQFLSDNSKLFTVYQNKVGDVVEFEANNDSSNLVMNALLPSITTSTIRVYPRSWHVDICLRIEFIGCIWRACSRRLGMESKEISHDQITFNTKDTDYADELADIGRLHGPVCWMADFGGTLWMEINLLELHTVTGIISQGGMSTKYDDETFMWPESYKVWYTWTNSTNTEDVWRIYQRLDGNDMDFQAYPDPVTEMRHDFDRPFIARRIRVQPKTSWRDTNCLRLELLGCRLRDTGPICGNSGVEYNGYCIGSVDDESPEACDKIFARGSHPLIVNSKQIQTFLNVHSEQFELKYRYQFVIGLTNQIRRFNGTEDFRWVDGTPLTFENFRVGLVTSELSNDSDVCVYADMDDRFSWRAYECEEEVLSRATICQHDIDECLGPDHGCSHYCVNFPGSYHCACPPGWHLNRINGKSCIGSTNCTIYESSHDIEDKSLRCAVEEELHCLKGSSMINEDCNLKNDLTATSEQSSFGYDFNPFIPYYSYEYNFVDFFESPSINSDNMIPSLSSSATDSGDNEAECKYEIADLRCECMWQSSPDTIFLKDDVKGSGFIQALAFPPLYHTGSWCEIRIEVPSNFFVRFLFHEMILRRQLDSSACLDTLDITDHIRSSGRSMLRGSFCGNQTDLVITCRSNNVTMRLYIGDLTSEMPKKLGFIASYNTSNCASTVDECDPGCGARETLSNESGEFSTANFPSRLPPFSICLWNITLPKDKYIALNFTDFIVKEDTSTGDCIDYVEFLTPGDIQLSHDVRRGHVVCGVPPPLIWLNTSDIVIAFKTGLDADSLGFKATYESRDVAGCGIGSYNGEGIHTCEYDEAAIATVNHPGLYAQTADYEWHIRTRHGSFIEIVFHHLDIPSIDKSCSNDYVMVIDTGLFEKESPKYCNDVDLPERPLKSSFNRLKVVFHARNSLRGTGFRAEYRARNFHPGLQRSDDRAVPSSCPSTWSQYNSNCYKFSVSDGDQYIRWIDAENKCILEGAHLVSILDVDEMNFLHYKLVTDWLTEENITYIGLTYDSMTKHRGWVDGSPMAYTDWFINTNRDDRFGPSQPDGGALEQCSKYDLRNLHSTNQWHDVPCASLSARQFICKRQLGTTDGGGQPNYISRLSTAACAAGWNVLNKRYCVKAVTFGDPTPPLVAKVSCPPGSKMLNYHSDDVMINQVLYYIRYVWRLSRDTYTSLLLFKRPQRPSRYQRKKPSDVDDADDTNCAVIVYRKSEWQVVTADSSSDMCEEPVTGLICMHEAEVASQTCSSSQFSCVSGECIQLIHVCDGFPDCQDHSDERQCPPKETSGCSAGSFTCGSGDCIPISYYCDFKPDCMDQSDERNCGYPMCISNQYACADGKCIDLSRRCDLIPDCIDYNGLSSDEMNCESAVGGFQCYDGAWLPAYAYCDGIKDCPGNTREDEPDSCDMFGCTEGDLQCENGACADHNALCLYDFDSHGYHIGCRDLTHLRYCELFDCPAFVYKCPGSYCIPQKRQCDGTTDCPGGEDELQCGNYSCHGAYHCHNSNYCITQSQVCDGNKDCISGDDEYFCGVTCPEGCSCSGFSVTCSDLVWTKTSASSLPKSSRSLNLTGIVQTSKRDRRSIASTVTAYHQNITLKQVAFIDLEEFPFLAELDISDIGISILLPGMFANQVNLYKLMVASNRISILLENTFLGLGKLTYLNLEGNPLLDIRPGAFKHLSNLPVLNLTSLRIRQIDENVFNGLSSLRQLSLKNNSLTSIASGAFVGLNQTYTLDIRENEKLQPIDMDIFVGLEQLTHLYADKYLFCCLVEYTECVAPRDQLSSCEDLLRNRVLRVAIWMLGFSALIGNIFVIIWRYRSHDREPSKKVQTFLILNLAISDLLMGTYMIIIASADMYFRDEYMIHAARWQASTLCQIAGFLSVLSSEASVFLLTLITTDRFLGVVFPFSRFRLRTKSSRVAAGIVWTIAVFLSLLPVTLQDVFGNRFYGRSSVCLALPLTNERTPGWEYSVIVFLGINLFLFVIIFICYFIMYIAIKRASRQCTRKRESMEEIKMATKMAIIVGTDFCCWMPIIIMGLLSLSEKVAIPHEMYAWAAVFILPVNSSANPYLYTISTLEMKRKRNRSPVSTASTQNVNAWKTEPSRDYSEMEMKTCSTVDKDSVLHSISSELSEHRLLPVLSHRCSAFLLSYYLATQCSMFTLKDVDTIDVDLRKALDFLHANDIAHGKMDEQHVIIDKERRGGRLAFLVMHGSPLRPHDVDDGIVHYDNSVELQMIEEEPMLQRDFRQLQELVGRLRDIIG